MEIKIKPHSFIDVITNSSTEIFTTAVDDAAEKVYEIINAIMAVCGAQGDASDFFEVDIVPDDFYNLSELAIEDEDFMDKYPEYESLEWEDRRKFLEENNRWEEVAFDSEYQNISMWISVKSKNDNKEIKKVSDNLTALFYSEEVYQD